jgi:hypothetical protein
VELLPDVTAPPFMVTGDPNSPGFTITSRPAALKGMIKTSLQSADAVFITITLKKGDEAVGGNSTIIPQNLASFTPFSMPISYLTEVIPDTAVITITIGNIGSGAPQAGSSFTIDALALGTTAGVASPSTSSDLQIIDRGRYHEIDFDLSSPSQTTLDVIDINGHTVATLFYGVSAGGSLNWDSSSLPSGLYICRLNSAAGVITRKINVLR